MRQPILDKALRRFTLHGADLNARNGLLLQCTAIAELFGKQTLLDPLTLQHSHSATGKACCTAPYLAVRQPTGMQYVHHLPPAAKV